MERELRSLIRKWGNQAQMTATVDGENTNRLEKGGLKLPLSHEDIEKQFPQVVFQKKTK
jgi:hypothetical protein